MKIPILQVALKTDADLIAARQRTKQIAAKSGLSLQDQTRVLTAVSELARNAVMYAGGGKLKLSIAGKDEAQYFEAEISDSGKGITALESILNETYVSQTGLGKGIAGSKRIVDKFSIETSERGTTVTIGKNLPPARSIVTPKTVAGWTRTLGPESTAQTPLDQLQEQNQQLMRTLEELEESRSLLQQQLQNVNDLNHELDQKSQALTKQGKDLAEASKHKGEFLANMSHEIRTPLNALLGINNILLRTNLDDEQRRLLGLAGDAGKALLALIDDILDLSKIEAGRIKLESRPFRPADVLQSSVQLLGMQAQEKMIEIVLDVASDVPPLIIGDQYRYRQILLNLLSNAVKFSESGIVKVTATMDRDGLLRCAVKDQGPGISKQDQGRLFQTFMQLDASTTRKHGGTGLGLAICKHLCDLFGGQIGIDSEPGKGATFWFTIPVQVADATAAGARSESHNYEPQTIAGDRKKNALVAEDHPINQLVARMELEQLGFSVDVVSNGQESIKATAEKEYAIILMDCQMPIMDGFEATRIIREQGMNVPIIALTANAMEGDRERCLSAGMTDYLSKPFEPIDLKQLVERVLEDTIEDEHWIQFSNLQQRFKPQQVQLLLTAFIEDLPRSAIEIVSFIADDQLDSARRIAHALKSACSTVFANRLAGLAQQLEASCASKERELASKQAAVFARFASEATDDATRWLKSKT